MSAYRGGTGARWGPEDDAFLRAVADRLPLHELIGEYVPLRRMGRDFRGPCPFHQGTHPNFSVTPGLEVYHCFVCGAKGNHLTFVRKRLGIGASEGRGGEAMQYLADRTGVARPQRRTMDFVAEAATEADRTRRVHALEFAYRFYRHARQVLAADVDALVASLNLSPEWVGQTGVLYAPAGHKLSFNVQKRCAPEAWGAFRSLGLVDFDGEPGSETARATMQDAVEHALLWAVADREQLVGLASVSAEGRRTFCSNPIAHRNPRRGRLWVAPSDILAAAAPRQAIADPVPAGADTGGTTSASAVPAAPSRCLVWATLADFLRLGARAAAAAADPTDPSGLLAVHHVVPIESWHLHRDDYVGVLRAQLRGDDVAGVLGPDGSDAYWMQPAWLELSGAVVRVEADGAGDASPRLRPRHVFEVALEAEPTFDPTDQIDAITTAASAADGGSGGPDAKADLVRQQALRGWWTDVCGARQQARQQARAQAAAMAVAEGVSAA